YEESSSKVRDYCCCHRCASYVVPCLALEQSGIHLAGCHIPHSARDVARVPRVQLVLPAANGQAPSPKGTFSSLHSYFVAFLLRFTPHRRRLRAGCPACLWSSWPAGRSE